MDERITMIAPEGRTQIEVSSHYYLTAADGTILAWPWHMEDLQDAGYTLPRDASVPREETPPPSPPPTDTTPLAPSQDVSAQPAPVEMPLPAPAEPAPTETVPAQDASVVADPPAPVETVSAPVETTPVQETEAPAPEITPDPLTQNATVLQDRDASLSVPAHEAAFLPPPSPPLL